MLLVRLLIAFALASGLAHLLSTRADAQIPQPGMGAINLSWRDCGDHGQSLEGFACNSNEGPSFVLVGSFVTGEVLPQFLSTFSWIDILGHFTDEPCLPYGASLLPDYWKHGFDPISGAPNCRTSGPLLADAHMQARANLPGSCADPYGGTGVAQYRYDVGFGHPANARIPISAFGDAPRPCPVSGDVNEEQTAFRIEITRAKTVGPDACSGCLTPLCLGIRFIRTEQTPDQMYDPSQQAALSRTYVSWFPEVATAARPTTWGTIKRLYR